MRSRNRGSKSGNSKKTKKYRPVADRLKSLQPVPTKSNVTLAGVSGPEGKDINCTISGYYRTQVFEFPEIDFHPNGDEPHHAIYASQEVQAHVTVNPVGYLSNSTFSKHYAISPSLRHVVGETHEKIKMQQKGHVPVFLVIEEVNQLTPVAMVKGECKIMDETMMIDGERVPRLIGGREGEQFITAWATIDGAWPELPNNELSVNLILAGVRVGQQSADPIRKYVNQNCLVTHDSRFVAINRLTMSARLSITRPMDTIAYTTRVCEITKAITAIEQDISVPHMALLIKSMYRDEYEDDAYQRLHYLRLWQSLAETAEKYLGYQGDVREDSIIVAGKHTLEELTEYRNNIAHWWTDTIDENLLADLQRTINELMRHKYF